MILKDFKRPIRKYLEKVLINELKIYFIKKMERVKTLSSIIFNWDFTQIFFRKYGETSDLEHLHMRKQNIQSTWFYHKEKKW